MIYVKLSQQFSRSYTSGSLASVLSYCAACGFSFMCVCVCACFYKWDPHPRGGGSEMPMTSYDSVWVHWLCAWLVCLQSKKELFRSFECSFCPCVNALRGPRVCIYVHTCQCVVLWCKDDVQMQRDTGVTAVRYSESLVVRGSLCV